MTDAQRAARECGVIAGLIAAGLAIDQLCRPWGQALVSVATFAVLGWIASCRSGRARIALWVCLAYATGGEVFLSLVWTLYTYRENNIPLFVPPGHVLLFTLGTHLAPRLPPRTWMWVGGLAALAAIALAAMHLDVLSLLLATLFLLCLAVPRGRALYATMFLLALAMEIYGTQLGNWIWARHVPYLEWPTLNPPFAAGVFYCLLDYLVLLTTSRIERWKLQAA